MQDKFQELISSEQPVLIDFYATWCGPCQAMAPVLENVKHEMGEAARVVKIDVDKFQEIAGQYQVQSIPTLMIFKKGALLWRHTGGAAGSELIKRLKSFA
ncbi:MAG: thioredoxin [Sphingobacteriales bacterium]|nr:MAG: thioredoxin [Sphingobacteriales bacterium]